MLLTYLNVLFCFAFVNGRNMSVVVSWKQLSYNFDGVLYTKSSDYERSGFDTVHFADELEDPEKFFNQYNNVPVGLEVDGDRIFITVPRRQHGIPSTLNYVTASDPVLRPYPDASCQDLVSVYRPRVDECGRLWVVDTGLLEVPGARKQVQPPSIVVYDLKTDKQLLKHELNPSVRVNDRTSAGLTSITVEVDPDACGEAYAYINDLATNGLIVFSLKDKDSWRLEHNSFKLEESAANFSVAGNVINWRDGLFSMALLTGKDEFGRRGIFFHPLVSTQEFFVYTQHLKSRDIGNHVRSGPHGYHGGTNTLLFSAVARDGVSCWRIDAPLDMEHVPLVAQDHEKLVYISDLKVKGDEVWVLANQIPRFIYSTLDPLRDNFYVLKANVYDLIRGSRCDRHSLHFY